MINKIITVVIFAIALQGCANIPDAIIGIDGQSIGARDVPNTKLHRIFIATTRAASNKPGVMFSGERGSLKFAHVDVSVPPTHESGKIERSKSITPDPRKHFVALDPNKLPDKTGFVSALNEALARLPPDQQNALVFIHGYNTSFDGALFRLAQFVNDSNYKGIPILFTWPSSGRVRDYLYDLNSALASRDELLETFKAVGQSNVIRGDILAHSMGNMLTIEALRQGEIEGSFKKSRATKLRHVVLASPDVDIYLFTKQLRRLPVKSHEFFALISRDDKALRFSKFLSGGISRVGNADVDALKNLGVTIIDLSDVKGNNGTHSKFAGSPEIVQALGRALASSGSIDTSPKVPIGVKVVRSVVGGVEKVVTIPRKIVQ